jgi:hypothetical protein
VPGGCFSRPSAAAHVAIRRPTPDGAGMASATSGSRRGAGRSVERTFTDSDASARSHSPSAAGRAVVLRSIQRTALKRDGATVSGRAGGRSWRWSCCRPGSSSRCRPSRQPSTPDEVRVRGLIPAVAGPRALRWRTSGARPLVVDDGRGIRMRRRSTIADGICFHGGHERVPLAVRAGEHANAVRRGADRVTGHRLRRRASGPPLGVFCTAVSGSISHRTERTTRPTPIRSTATPMRIAKSATLSAK